MSERADQLEYWIYGQDGKRVHLSCQNTDGMRRFTAWLRQHDRYTAGQSPVSPLPVKPERSLK